MNYEMRVDPNGDVVLVDEEQEELLCIYWAGYMGYESSNWPEGFWNCPDWCIMDMESSRERKANVDYHEHRDEYIAEAKKLLIKEML